VTPCETFKIGDLVAVFGGEIGKEGKHADDATICRVLACGERDLVVEEVDKRFRRIPHHTVPQSICHNLTLNPSQLETDRPLFPQPGDLVLSYSKDAYKSEEPTQLTGILYKTTYQLGNPHTCTLICDGEMKEVTFKSLLVLQRKSNKP